MLYLYYFSYIVYSHVAYRIRDRIANCKISMCDEQNGINKFEIQHATCDTTRKFDRSTSCRCVDTEQNSNLSRRLYASFSDFSRDFHCHENPVLHRSASRILILFYPKIVSPHCYYSFKVFMIKIR